MLAATRIREAEVLAAGRKLVRQEGKQVLLIARAGRIFAIANRCPHEGYPLSEGTLGPGCVLTCNWHNWKFDLGTGEALAGRDPVRTYPVAVKGGEIWLDLADPPAEAQRARALGGLQAALGDNDAARMAREVARLERAGYDGRKALVHALNAVNDRFEDGATHAHGAAADWLELSARAATPQLRLAALLEPIGHLAWDSQGAGAYPYPVEARRWDESAFLAAVEAEREHEAVSRVRGALAEGRSLGQLRAAFGKAALAHYADFGHSAIYSVNLARLDDMLGGEATEALALSLTRSVVRATREERLPEFRGYARALAEWDGSGTRRAAAEDFVGMPVDAILARTLGSSGRPARELFDALLGAAGWNMLHFDIAVQEAAGNAIADNVGWLDFTHALTFASAARELCEEAPALWPSALLQLALFVGRNRKYVRDAGEAAGWTVTDRARFLSEETHALYDHGVPEPIVACHRLKVLNALRRELACAPDAPWAAPMCAAVNRYLHVPMKRHHGLRNASQALDFVAREG
ncbi:MAG TPA: Rieske (2Fe-2S) protein [Rhizomicrobium sp.]|nr:Rieske (2Fe-2S) protein [Rhizomicrobium sp.]